MHLLDKPGAFNHSLAVAVDNLRYHRMCKLERVLERKRSDLMREAIDLLCEKYVANLEE